jgi:Tfp pilus assembly protein PilF
MLAQNDLHKAEVVVRQSIALEPHLAHPIELLGTIALRQGSQRLAWTQFERALELAPWRADWRAAQVQRLMASGETNRARRVLEAAPEDRPELRAVRLEIESRNAE